MAQDLSRSSQLQPALVWPGRDLCSWISVNETCCPNSKQSDWSGFQLLFLLGVAEFTHNCLFGWVL